MRASSFSSPLHTPAPPLRLLLLGYGQVAQALLPLCASRQAWLEKELHVRPLVSGIGTRSTGYYLHGRGANSVISLETEAMGTITLVEHEHEPAVLQATH